MSDGGTGQSLPRITAGTSSETINTIQLMSNESPALPHVSQSHVSYSPGVRRVTSCHDPRARQLPPDPKPTVPTGTPGTATSAGQQGGRAGRTALPVSPPGRWVQGGSGALLAGDDGCGGETCGGEATLGAPARDGRAGKAPVLPKAKLGTTAHAAQKCRGRLGSHLLHRAGCIVPAAASTRGGGGGDGWRAGAARGTCVAALCSSLPRRLPRRCCSSRRPPPPRSRRGPAPETSSRLSGGEKADTG